MKNFYLENENGRSLFPICEVDAPLFLSDVYNNRYTSEKTTSRYPQSGRSMIEMLGVLAIIGVLSVGGIAGYSKAMMKYRINKTIEQITLIAGNVQTFFAPQKSYEGVKCSLSDTVYGGQTDGDGCPVVKKAKIIPDEMLTLDADGKITDITDAFGGGVNLYSPTSTGMSEKSFSLWIDNIPQEACIELATYDWSSANVAIIRAGTYFSTPVSINDATEYCEDNGSMIFFFGNIDVATFMANQ